MPATRSGPRAGGRLALWGVLFFFSGFPALVYQVIWQRLLGLFSGIHVGSVVIIVAAYMAGLGFGSLLGGRVADRLGRREAVLGFAVCEIVIGLFGLLSPWIFYDLVYVRLGFLARYALAVPVIHFGAVLVPTLLMGASLPLLARGLVLTLPDAPRTLGLLYGANTLGAAAGAGAAAWLLIGRFGFAGTITLAALVNLVIGATALRAAPSARRVATVALDVAPAVLASTGRARRPGPWFLLYGAAGFLALSLEIVWFRVLDVGIKSSPYTFGHLLAILLGFMGLGSLVGALVVPRFSLSTRTFLWCQWGIAALAGVAVLILVSSNASAVGQRTLATYWYQPEGIELSELFWSLAHWGGKRAAYLLSRMVQVYLLMPLGLIAVPAFLMGFAFPCVQRAAQTDLRALGWRVGGLQAANILGAIGGTLVTGSILIDRLGTSRSLALLVGSGALFAGAAALRERRRPVRALGAAAAVASVALALALPPPAVFWARLHGTDPDGFVAEEDASGVAALQDLGGVFALRVNGRGHALLPYGDATLLYGLVPALLHPRPNDVAVIGLGTGQTAWALAASGACTRLDVYELVRREPSVVATALRGKRTYPALERLFADPALSLEFIDGRLGLRLSGRRYDLIETDALAPSMSCSGIVYSKEFYELCRRCLDAGGFFVSWIPTERALRTFATVFPHVLGFHTRDFPSFAIGSEMAPAFDAEALRARLDDPAVREYLASSGEEATAVGIVRRFLDQVRVVAIDDSNRGAYTNGDLNTDLFPRDEFDKSYDASYR